MLVSFFSDHELWILGLPLPEWTNSNKKNDKEEITVRVQNFAHDLFSSIS